MTNTQEINGDPAAALASAIVGKAVRDARAGDLSAYRYLVSDEAATIMDELGWSEDTARQLAECEKEKIFNAAARRTRKPKGIGPGKLYLVLAPVPDEPDKYLVAGELSWDRSNPEKITTRELEKFRRQKYGAIFMTDPRQNPARPRRSLLEHLAAWLTWSSKLFEKGV